MTAAPNHGTKHNLRAPVTTWLAAIESSRGPLPSQLRHTCFALARFMSGDGSDGCFPGTRKLAERIGVHRATVGRWLRQLVQLGWLDCELRRRQFGRLGGHYFPALPMAHSDVSNFVANGSPERANLPNGASRRDRDGALESEIGARSREIGAPERARLLLTPTEKSAAAPSPVIATGSAALEPDPHLLRLRAKARPLQEAGLTDEEVAAQLGVTTQQAATWRAVHELIRRAQRQLKGQQ
jgi:hypothetical protein